MKKRSATFILTIVLIVFSCEYVSAQDPLPPGYGREWNSDWWKLCSSDGNGGGSPLSDGFDPNDSTVWFSVPDPPYPNPASPIEDRCRWKVIIDLNPLTADYPQEGHAPLLAFQYSVKTVLVTYKHFTYHLFPYPRKVAYHIHLSNNTDIVEEELIWPLIFPTTPHEDFEPEVHNWTYTSPANTTIQSISVRFPPVITDDYLNVPAALVPIPDMNIYWLKIEGYYPQATLAPSPTRTSIPRTPTRTPTPRSTSLWTTPTASPSASATLIPTISLPRQYSHVPTSIPVLSFPAWPPAPTFAPVATPGALIAFAEITPTLAALYTPDTFSQLNPLPNITPTPYPTVDTWAGQIVTFTNWLSSETASLRATDTFTIASAPNWYAPPLPRPLADVGWTFEQMQNGIDTGQRYSLDSWAAFAGYIASLPIQLAKTFWDFLHFLGPFGLFMSWLLIMLPLVLYFNIFVFIKNLIIGLFNFILQVVRFILELIKLLPFV